MLLWISQMRKTTDKKLITYTFINIWCSSPGSTLSFFSTSFHFLCPPPLPPPHSAHVNGVSSSARLQRASADAQHRVVGEAEDLSGAALWLHCGRPAGPRRDRPRGVRLRQQDGPQANWPDHGCKGDLLIDTPGGAAWRQSRWAVIQRT